MNVNLEDKPWSEYIGEDLRELFKESLVLLETVPKWETKFADYSFIVFPAAKGYEGFLKKFFLDLKFITEEDYYGKHFRIGKSLNPALRPGFNGDSIYNKIINYCGGKDLANNLWETWKQGRNLLFHWFPNEKNAINFEEAKSRVEMIIAAIDRAFTECKIK